MFTLIVPAAGMSTRYPTDIPKFLWTHPSGLTMLAAGLVGLQKLPIDKVVVVSLKTYFKEGVEEALSTSIEKVLGVRPEFVLLEKSTPSMVDTIVAGIEHLPNDQSIVVKDTDNLVEIDFVDFATGDNFIAYADLGLFHDVPAFNKSFVEIDALGFLTNIVEKRVVSPYINTGLVGFAAASDFLLAASRLMGSNEKFVSDVIRVSLEQGGRFQGFPASSYQDWGTHQEWVRMKDSFENLFVWLEDIIFAANEPGLSTSLNANLQVNSSNTQSLLKHLGKEANSGEQSSRNVVFLSNLPEDSREAVEKALSSVGFDRFRLLMGLPLGRSTLVVSYSDMAPPPNGRVVEISSNSDTLGHHLR